MKTINKLFIIGAISLFMMSCSSDDDEIEPATLEPVNVFERLQGKTYKQVEKEGDCFACEDEINYYTFSKENMTVAGTDVNGICEQYDITPIGDCDECAEVLQNNEDKLVVTPPGSPLNISMTITFKSDTEVEFDYPVPILGATWTAQLYTGEVPCTDWAPSQNPTFTGVFDGTEVNETELGTTFMWPSSAKSYAGFANENENIYPLSFPNGGSITFTAATSGVDIDVRFRIEFDKWPDVNPNYDTPAVTISGTSPTEYTVEIPAQGTNTYKSMLFYLMTNDQELIVSSDFVLTIN
jgi:hypothetical protein